MFVLPVGREARHSEVRCAARGFDPRTGSKKIKIMNNEQTLISLGFRHYKMWDSSQTKHYRLEKEGIIFRAFVVECNGPVYVVLGVVIKANGKFDIMLHSIYDVSI